MSDDPKLELVKAGLESLLVKEAYRDLARPAFRETGQAIGQVGALLNSALRPLKSLQLAWNTLFDRLDGWITEELRGVDKEDLREPPTIIVGGVIQGLLFAQDEPELRALFVRLLATSMVNSLRAKAHPAFAELIKQMTPLEARIICDMADKDAVASLRIRACVPKDGRNYTHWRDPWPGMSLDDLRGLHSVTWNEPWDDDLVFFPYDVGTFADHAPVRASLENLQRLSLIQMSEDVIVDGDSTHGYLEVALSEMVSTHIARIRGENRFPWFSMGVVQLTVYGRLFVDSCVVSPNQQQPATNAV